MTLDVTITVPDVLFDLPAWVASVTEKLDVVLNEAAVDFKATYATWSEKNQPDSSVTPAKLSGNSIKGAVRITGEIYALVNYGTEKKRPRAARTPRGMRFRTGYRPRTSPGRIGSGSSARTGPWVTKHRVNSGPITPRRFDIAVAKSRTPDFRRAVVDAINEVA